MELGKNQKIRDLLTQQGNMDHSCEIPDMSIIQNCYQQKKVSLLSEQQLITDSSYYISLSIQQIPNHKVYIMYITSYRIYLMCTVDSQVVSIPHAYIKDYTCFDNQIRFTLKTSLRYFLVPEQISQTQVIYQNLVAAQKLIPFSLNVKFKQQQPEIYDCLAQMQRMLINWKKVVAIDNKEGKEIPSYPKILFAPAKISKQVVKQSQQSRFNLRIPVLTYFDSQAQVSLWRCGHTIKQQNNKYDYAYLQSISSNLLIIQIQLVQNKRQSIYGGFNHFKNQIKYSVYKFQSPYQVKLNYEKVVQGYLKQEGGFFRVLGKWYEEVQLLIRCAFKCSQQLKAKRHVLIQENDYSKKQTVTLSSSFKGGVDRACQLCALIQIVSDPYYRSIQGFCVLIQKQFISFGYPFHTRCGIQPQAQSRNNYTNKPQYTNLMSSIIRQSNSKSGLKSNEISFTFIQFLQSLNQLISCFPTYFQYSSQFLAQVGYQLFSGKYSNFLFNSIHEKDSYPEIKKTYSIYRYLALKKKYYNVQFDHKKSIRNLVDARSLPNVKEFLIWKQYWNIITKMNCGQSQIEDKKQIRQFKNIIQQDMNK